MSLTVKMKNNEEITIKSKVLGVTFDNSEPLYQYLKNQYCIFNNLIQSELNSMMEDNLDNAYTIAQTFNKILYYIQLELNCGHSKFKGLTCTMEFES